MTDFLIEGPDEAVFTILLAHGAGAPMDSKSMTAASAALTAAGFRIARFEFAYMAARRTGSRRPPPKAEALIQNTVPLLQHLGSTINSLSAANRWVDG